MVRHWNHAADGEFSEAALRRKLEAQGYIVTRYVYPPGTTFAEHTHPVDKIDAVVSGRFRLVVAGHFAVLGPGDWIAVRRGVHHSAAVIGDEPVVSLDGVLLQPGATRSARETCSPAPAPREGGPVGHSAAPRRLGREGRRKL